ncbi:MAG: SIMPL domain-containing protein, partial [Clostridiales bacterium]|nr:SIMPL domain-containing protein [Clostridiales bacterium]
MKKLFLTALAVAMAALLAVGPAVAESNPQAAGKITVYGSATVSVAPDVVRVSLGVQEHADEVGLAQSQVNDKINAIVAALKEAGIADSDITTSDYMIYRDTQYDPQTGESKFVGYVAST